MNRRSLCLPLTLLLSLLLGSYASILQSRALVSSAQPDCNKTLVVSVGGKSVYKLNDKSAVFYRADLEVDADGSPKAYHPTNNKIALDYKANGYPWAIVFVGKKPYIQGPNDPAPGFYVSKTSLEDIAKKATDPGRYVNSEEIPYIVLPPAVMKKASIKKGDLAVVINKGNGKSSYAIFADVGPKSKIGEGSIALAKALGINKNPKTGGPHADVIYLVFPGSGDGKPKPIDEINSKGAELFTTWGGMGQINACFPQ
jgi:hypothetical protein